MAPKRPYDEKKVWESASYIRDSWVHQASKIAMPALSHWHAAHMDGLVREARIKKNFEDYYWGALVLTDSYLAWGGASLNAYTMIGLDLRWIDMIGTDPRRQAVPVKNPPPNDYIQLVVTASKKNVTDTIMGFPGAQTTDYSRPVTEGNTVIWGFAVPRSPAEQMMMHLGKHLNDGRFGKWESETSFGRSVLARVEEYVEPEYTLMDSILEDMTDEERARFALATSENAELSNVFCTSCGTKNPGDANFCAKCGSKLVKL